ncbi:MAG: DNA primase [Burkholderiales bacterium]|nr:DNA primase [Burkholderiales bacterium]
MIPNDFIQTLLSRVDIVEVIDRHVPLRKAGANYVACCPFHSEKTPSFSVSPTKQFYHCFGCGAHGTAIGFLMEHVGRSFPDAVEELARDAGLEVPRVESAGDRERREVVADLNAMLLAAAKFFRAQLKDAPQAIDYLKSRGLTGEVAVRFGVGYAPDGWQSLAAVFPKYDDPALEAAGLVIGGDAGKRYDRFRDRVMFPIHDTRGRVIGFGGRVLGTGEPKYLNSPETPVFSKGRELYGLYLARNAIRDAGKVVVVEGYMDVVALAQHGVEYAVATLGTATTPVHAQKLFRLTDCVVFCFDGDAAGRKAAWRALENTLPEMADGKDARFLFLPDGEDPDDFIRQRGRTAFERAVDSAIPLSEFLLFELAARHPPNSSEGRAALVAAARPLLAQIAAPVLSAILRKRVAEVSGLPEAELRGLLAAAATGDGGPPHRRDRGAPDGIRPGSRPPLGRGPVRRPPSLLRLLIRGLLLQPALVRSMEFPRPEDGTSEAATLSALVVFCARAEDTLTTAGVLQAFADTAHAQVLASALAAAEDQRLDDQAIAAEVHEGLARWWQQARRSGMPAPAPNGSTTVPEEDQRVRQLQYVRQRTSEARAQGAADADDGPSDDPPPRDII